jgi:hypothetical protein
MGNTRTPKKVLNGKFCGRRTMGRHHQERLLLAAEYKKLKEVSRGQDHLEVNY